VEAHLQHDYQQEGVYTITVSLAVNPPRLPVYPPDGGGGGSDDENFPVLLSQSTTLTIEQPAEVYYVRQLYRDLLHRTPDERGLDSWVGELHNGVSRQAVAAGIQASEEFRHITVEGLYGSLLHRHSDPTGLQNWVSALGRGATLERVKAGFHGSPEYVQRRGQGIIQGFLIALYQDVLHRPLELGGLAAWDAALAAGRTTRDVGLAVLKSPEAAINLVTESYEFLLDRNPDASGGEHWAEFLSDHGGADLAQALLGSQECLNRALSAAAAPVQADCLH
jgi:hypothetical protein